MPTVWSWTGDVSEWPFASPRGPTPLRLASTWADPHSKYRMVHLCSLCNFTDAASVLSPVGILCLFFLSWMSLCEVVILGDSIT